MPTLSDSGQRLVYHLRKYTVEHNWRLRQRQTRVIKYTVLYAIRITVMLLVSCTRNWVVLGLYNKLLSGYLEVVFDFESCMRSAERRCVLQFKCICICHVWTLCDTKPGTRQCCRSHSECPVFVGLLLFLLFIFENKNLKALTKFLINVIHILNVGALFSNSVGYSLG